MGRTGSWMEGRTEPALINHVLSDHVDGRVHVCRSRTNGSRMHYGKNASQRTLLPGKLECWCSFDLSHLPKHFRRPSTLLHDSVIP